MAREQPKAAEPQPTTGEPLPKAAGPQLQTEEPQPDAGEQPEAAESQPTAERQQPAAEVPQPAAEVQQPAAAEPQPKAETQQPETATQQSEARTPQPEAEARQPEAEARQPEAEAPQPKAESQQPEAEEPQPKAQTQQPETEKHADSVGPDGTKPDEPRAGGKAKPSPRPQAAAKPHPGRSRRRSRIAGFVAALVVVVGAAGAAAVALASRGSDDEPSASAATTTEELAATWVDRQVSHGVIVACDPDMCSTLRQHGFAGRKLEVIKPGSPYPARAQVVVETPAVERQFGHKLATNLASESLATFGSGSQQISVRITTPGGPAAYRAQLAMDAQSRRKLARYLLGSRGVSESPSARKQLVAGQVDTRLIIVLTALAADEPGIDIASFGPLTAGGSSSLPLRSVNLSLAAHARPASRAAFVRSLKAVVDHQARPWHRSSDGVVRIAGKAYFQIMFAAPSPLGLLPGGVP